MLLSLLSNAKDVFTGEVGGEWSVCVGGGEGEVRWGERESIPWGVSS